MKRMVLGGLLAGMVLASGAASAQTPSSPLSVWLINPYGDVDGVLLRDGRAIYFTPDVGRMLTAAIRIGDTLHVDVRGGRRLLVDEVNGSQFDLTSPPRGGGPVGIPALQRHVARGRIVAFTRVTDGAVGGFVLDTGEQVRVPPSQGVRLSRLRVGDTVTVRGLGNRSRWGLGLRATAVYDRVGNPVLEL